LNPQGQAANDFNAEDLANKLNQQSADITSSDGYSLIPVVIWSADVSSIVNCVNHLDKSKVRIAAPDEFVALIKKNIIH
jgi:hypothetical protein